jgi:hypothetical protein
MQHMTLLCSEPNHSQTSTSGKGKHAWSSRLHDYPTERCTFCLWNESKRTENLLLIGFLPEKEDAVPLIEVRQYPQKLLMKIWFISGPFRDLAESHWTETSCWSDMNVKCHRTTVALRISPFGIFIFGSSERKGCHVTYSNNDRRDNFISLLVSVYIWLFYIIMTASRRNRPGCSPPEFLAAAESLDLPTIHVYRLEYTLTRGSRTGKWKIDATSVVLHRTQPRFAFTLTQRSAKGRGWMEFW